MTDAAATYLDLSSAELHARAVVLLGADYLDAFDLESVDDLRDPEVLHECVAVPLHEDDRYSHGAVAERALMLRITAATTLADAVMSDRVPAIWAGAQRCFTAGMHACEVRSQLQLLAAHAIFLHTQRIDNGPTAPTSRLPANLANLTNLTNLATPEAAAVFALLPCPRVDDTFHVIHQELAGGQARTTEELADRLLHHTRAETVAGNDDSNEVALRLYLHSLVDTVIGMVPNFVRISRDRWADLAAVVGGKVFTHRVDSHIEGPRAVDGSVDLSPFACFDHFHLDGPCSWLGCTAYGEHLDIEDDGRVHEMWAETARRCGRDPAHLTVDWNVDEERPSYVRLDGVGAHSNWRSVDDWVPGFDRPRTTIAPEPVPAHAPADPPLVIALHVEHDQSATVRVLADCPAVKPELVTRVREAYDRLQGSAARNDAPVAGLDQETHLTAAEQCALIPPANLYPVFVETIVAELLVAHPGCFVTPEAPITDLFLAAGLVLRDGEALHDTTPWDRADAVTTLRHLRRDFGDRTADVIEQLIAMIDNPEPSNSDLARARRCLDESPIVPVVAQTVLRTPQHTYLAPPDAAAREALRRRAAVVLEERSEALLAFAERIVISSARLDHQCSAHLLAAHALFALHRPDDAVARIELTATATDPPAEALHDLGGVAFDAGDYRTAIRWWSHLEDRPSSMELAEIMVRAEYPVVGRNDRCPCGSGRKYKQCHLGQRAEFDAGGQAAMVAGKVKRMLQDGGPGERDILATWVSIRMAKVWAGPDGRRVLSFGSTDDDTEVGTEEGTDESFEVHVRGRSVAADPDALPWELAAATGNWHEWYLDRRGALLPEGEERLLEGFCAQRRRRFEVTADHGPIVGPDDPLVIRDSSSTELLTVSFVPAPREKRSWTAGEQLVVRPWPLADGTWCLGGDVIVAHPAHIEMIDESLAEDSPNFFNHWAAGNIDFDDSLS